MATTTNYGWETPDDTDLVKDGASAIRTLGSSIDTTTKALNPETTLGDISYRSSTANTNTRLALGTAGQVLTVNSGATAPEWTTLGASYTEITSTTFNNTASTYSYSSLGTYKHIIIIGNGLQSASATVDRLLVRFNSDSGSNYSFTNAVVNGGTITDDTNTGGTSLRTGGQPLAITTDTSARFGRCQMWIMDYRGSGYKQVEGIAGSYANGAAYGGAGSAQWNSTSAITSITILTGSGSNFKAGVFKLYGVN